VALLSYYVFLTKESSCAVASLLLLQAWAEGEVGMGDVEGLDGGRRRMGLFDGAAGEVSSVFHIHECS